MCVFCSSADCQHSPRGRDPASQDLMAETVAIQYQQIHEAAALTAGEARVMLEGNWNSTLPHFPL